ncbi:hypothetical protein SMGD1_1836 [Sulfurimonas gotlandica GD1]|jgi:hypothetical protein|uniref:Uncharacterized protein n=1 Tax=Sulfurimonas gotlandica (strain DSM 19862 / JCM 16533 / GD1) TaxID=929558 RepID=B6BIK4_SULGG|nr:hypothetical protein [Sulfurimonas gotlandica]EDZ63068.1 hypothetical protein CBGD1_687 [Sulfurimonas gotlandica GD1]EHP30359.1 hypothetical protein SMGD1_1836 [Sulfurimonas gotlandica GD1]
MFGDVLIVPAVVMIIGASFFFLIASLVGLLSDGFVSENKIG